MSLTVQLAHAASQQTQPEQAPAPVKQAAMQSAAPQDKATISDSAKQALSNNTKPA